MSKGAKGPAHKRVMILSSAALPRPKLGQAGLLRDRIAAAGLARGLRSDRLTTGGFC
jgi:hypothetical protein